jgi:hypothetical protein
MDYSLLWKLVDTKSEAGYHVSCINYGSYFEITQRYEGDEEPPVEKMGAIFLSRNEVKRLIQDLQQQIEITNGVEHGRTEH